MKTINFYKNVSLLYIFPYFRITCVGVGIRSKLYVPLFENAYRYHVINLKISFYWTSIFTRDIFKHVM
jgi:hypothetical protein